MGWILYFCLYSPICKIRFARHKQRNASYSQVIEGYAWGNSRKRMSQIMGSNLFLRDKLLYKIHRRHLAFVHSEMDMAISARFVTEPVYKKSL